MAPPRPVPYPTPPPCCELCGSTQDHLNFHHLIPRTLHSRKWFRDRFTTEDLRGRGLWLCKFHCHRQIHEFFKEVDLGRRLNTRELLLQHPLVAKYVAWRAKRNT